MINCTEKKKKSYPMESPASCLKKVDTGPAKDF